MSLQILLKKSNISQKQPFASDLGLGEIALNYNADGPFLTCKDTNGDVRKLNNVWVNAAAPTTATAGDLWLDTSGTAPALKVYKDATTGWTVTATVPAATTSTQGAVMLASTGDVSGGATDKVVTADQLKATNDAVTVINGKVADATTTTKGVVQLADAAAITAGTAGLVVDAAQLKSAAPANASETVTGIVELATAAETTTGTDNTRAVHPAGLKVELDKKANLASPALTGTPTAPTAAPGTNTTQVATTAFVEAATQDATTTSKGIVQLADSAAVTAGTVGRVVDAAQLKAVSDAVKAEDLWDRTGTEITPKTAGDSVFTSGAVKVGGTTAAPNITLNDAGGRLLVGSSSSINNDSRIQIKDGHLSLYKSADSAGAGSGVLFHTDGGGAATQTAEIDALQEAAGASGGALVFSTTPVSGTTPLERFRIDSKGRALFLSPTSISTNSISAGVQINSTSNNSGAAMSIVRFNKDNLGGQMILGKSRNTTTAVGGIVHNNDSIGQLAFVADDGTDMATQAARIQCFADGTPAVDDMPGRVIVATTPAGSNNPVERLRISSDGTVSIGTAGVNAGRLLVQETSAVAATFNRNTTNGELIELRRTNVPVGSISVTASATSYNTSSDYRLKENVVPLTGAVDRLNQLQVRRFNFIADPGTTVDGFIAHEAQAVVPECVTGEKDAVDENGKPRYQGIDQSKLVPLLTAALQEALARIEQLEVKVAALEGGPTDPAKDSGTGSRLR